MFWNKQINSQEYEKLFKKIIELENKVISFNVEVETLKTNVNSLRGLVNRKLNPQKDEEEQQEETQDIKSTKYY